MGESYSIVYVCTASSLPIHFFSSVQLLRRVWLFSTPWTAACQASLSITNAQSLLKLTSIESVMPSDHLILCHPLLLLPSIFLSFRVFSNESRGQSIAASASVLPVNIQGWFPLGFPLGLISLLSKGRSRVSSSSNVTELGICKRLEWFFKNPKNRSSKRKNQPF